MERTLEQEKKLHNLIVYITVGIVALAGAIGLGVTTAKAYEGPGLTATGYVAGHPHKAFGMVAGSEKAGCKLSPRVCSVLDRTQQLWSKMRNGGCGDCSYTSTQLKTIQNNRWLNKSLVATSQLRTPHSTNGWSFGDRGVGVKSKANNCAKGAIPWTFWATHREPSLCGGR